ncbi:urease accessory protein UreF [Phormidium pseudopriestleyi FRX01]|uniref:Urease accessory protein UreF n=1 Tax=Phormidium pseudopriestleyi FRX01 TaxID=1759528 RepID=A0ABS3FV22_9CYAN|nr:urease accessory protein UreF [Phormidium pseudopriestleyi]MBO0350969.1 urease accessory protein UreF [Phormidium pseudopriestleyi FRX01]
MVTNFSLLSLLQLASPALPVGAYSYSEGLEMLVERGIINSVENLQNWIKQELHEGAIYLDGAVMVRALNAAHTGNCGKVKEWNQWSSATRETEELREQSWQMGNALLRLLMSILPVEDRVEVTALGEEDCNFAVAFGIAASYWQIPPDVALLGYLHSWTCNFIGAGVKLIPLGQTAGQQLLFNLQPNLVMAVQTILRVEDDNLSSCTWGLSLASMQHETQYSRLFRS